MTMESFRVCFYLLEMMNDAHDPIILILDRDVEMENNSFFRLPIHFTWICIIIPW